MITDKQLLKTEIILNKVIYLMASIFVCCLVVVIFSAAMRGGV